MRGDLFTGASFSGFPLHGLTIGPPQVCGAIRLVPLIRDSGNDAGDLRLAVRRYSESATIVQTEPRIAYTSYVPHGLILNWTEDGAPVAAWGGQLLPGQSDGKRFGSGVASVRFMDRLVKRERSDQLRLLPLHLAMEGFLALYFGGPEIAWAEYSHRTYRRGLSPRSEQATTGEAILGLSEALRVFEIAEGQVGVLVFVADALASVFITPHSEDYRAVQDTLLRDFYGDLIAQYALMYQTIGPDKIIPEARPVQTFDDLRREVTRMQEAWSDYGKVLASGLLDQRTLHSQTVREMGPFRLIRFITDLDPSGENHIGEAILRKETGEMLYAKSFRLSAAQTRRAFFLSQLAHHLWNLDDTAAALGMERADLVLRIERAGFDYLFTPEVRAAARKARGMRGDAPL